VPKSRKNVILTAAYNLIDDNKQYAKNLKIVRGDRVPHLVQKKDVFICASYKEYPSNTNKHNDLGMILVPKDWSPDPFGFGYNLLFAAAEPPSYEAAMGVIIAGYHDPNDDVMVMTSGKGWPASDEQLEYSCEALRGMSGSPVIVAYDGVEIVIGIQ
jgi:V8-like Glu-specific endopeptidase